MQKINQKRTRRVLKDVTNAFRGMEQNAVDGMKKIALNKRVSVDAPIPSRSKIQQVSCFVKKTNNVHNGGQIDRNNVPDFGTTSQSYQHIGRIDDIDERDSSNPVFATDFVLDMYERFRKIEEETSARANYMKYQSEINESMRSILVDWLIEVHLKFKMVPETLYLTVNLIDRYLERNKVSKHHLQLVAVGCLFIASKYEEIFPPQIRDLVYICDKAYNENEIIKMEEIVLKSLEYRITVPSAHTFFVRFLKAAHADQEILQISCYILDGTLQAYSLLNYLPSQLAAAAIFIARRTVGRNPWSPTLLKYASYSEEEIIPVARAVLEAKSSSSSSLRAVNKKYRCSRDDSVANIVFECDF